MEEIATIAKAVEASGLFRGVSRYDAAAMILMGEEIGLKPMESIRLINRLRGKAVCSSGALVAIVHRSPECEWFRLVESTNEVAHYATKRVGCEAVEASWTMEDAERAGLGGKFWRRHPAAMLRARCSGHLARRVYSDVLSGLRRER